MQVIKNGRTCLCKPELSQYVQLLKSKVSQMKPIITANFRCHCQRIIEQERDRTAVNFI